MVWLRHHAAGGLVFLLALGLTDGALDVLRGVDPGASPLLEVSVLVIASALATISRYVALRTWVFAAPGGLRRRAIPLALSQRRP